MVRPDRDEHPRATTAGIHRTPGRNFPEKERTRVEVGHLASRLGGRKLRLRFPNVYDDHDAPTGETWDGGPANFTSANSVRQTASSSDVNVPGCVFLIGIAR